MTENESNLNSERELINFEKAIIKRIVGAIKENDEKLMTKRCKNEHWILRCKEHKEDTRIVLYRIVWDCSVDDNDKHFILRYFCYTRDGIAFGMH